MKYWVTVNGRKYEVEVERKGDYTPLRRAYESAPAWQPDGIRSGHGLSAELQTARLPQEQTQATEKRAKDSEAQPARQSVQGENGRQTELPSPLPGKVLELRCAVGQKVQEGDCLLILEAMKMENEICSPAGGTIEAIHVAAGDSCNSGDSLLTIASL